MSNKREEYHYLENEKKFLSYAYQSLHKHFTSYDEFLYFYKYIESNEAKNLFLKVSSFYLFTVKNGDWYTKDTNVVIEYITNTYKYISIFSLIESLSKENFIDFYTFMKRKKSKISFPITDKDNLDEIYRQYKIEYGSIQQCVSFFNKLPLEQQELMVSHIRINKGEPSIEELAKHLYSLRSKYVHEAKFNLQISQGTVISNDVICNLSIENIMIFFEKGLIQHFISTETTPTLNR